MKNFEQFTNLYSLSKTLRFELKPVGRTLENMRNRIYKGKLDYDSDLQTFLHDQEIENAYQTLKPVLDKLHEDFITQSLESEEANQIDFAEYFEKYKAQADDKGEKKLREKIGKTYQEGEEFFKSEYSSLGLKWKKGSSEAKGAAILECQDILEVIRQNFSEDKKIQDSLDVFKGFFTYFGGFNQNRANYYKTEGKASQIATRIIDENLPKFCDNAIQFEYVIKKKKNKESGKMDEEKNSRKEEYENAYKYLKNKGKTTQIKDAESGKMIEALQITAEIFDINHFSRCLSQPQIEEYNKKIGHYNSLINLYNQAKRSEEKDSSNKEKTFKDLPKFKTLFKQIGCGKKKALFFALTHDTKAEAGKVQQEGKEAFSVEEVLELAKKAGDQFFQGNNDDGVINTVPKFLKYLMQKESYEGVYWSKSTTDRLSNMYFDNYYALKDKLKDAKIFKMEKGEIKIPETIELSGLFAVLDATENWKMVLFKSSVMGDEKKSLIINHSKTPSEALLKMIFADIEENIDSFFQGAEGIKKLSEYETKESKAAAIKPWMDCALIIQQMLKYFMVREGKIKGDPLDSNISEGLKNLVFEAKLEDGTEVDWFKWYDALRNYLTKKPQDDAKKNKLKLNFENPTIAGGWDINKETANTCVLLRNNQGKMFLAVMNKNNNTVFQKEWVEGRGKNKNIQKNPLYKTEEGGEFLEKMEYDFWSDVSRMIPKCSTQLKAVIGHFKSSDQDFIFPVGYKVSSGEKFSEECKISKDVFELNNKVYKLQNGEVISAMRYELTKEQEKSYTKAFQKGYWEMLVKCNNPEIKEDEITNKWIKFVKNGPLSEEDNIYKDKLSIWIDFCKYFLSKYPKTTLFEYDFDETSNYKSVDKFNLDVDISSYKLKIDTKINKSLVDKYVEEGKIYLFEIKNQDSNEGKKDGHKNNLHTIYWNALFQEIENRPKLNGEAEIFYRKALSEKDLKKKIYKGKEIIENYRFSKEKFVFHVPITLNFCLDKRKINDIVNSVLPLSHDTYFLGIDRGEKHLAYFSLINQKGEIVDQGTLNLPFTDKDGNPRTVQAKKRTIGEDGKEKVEVVQCKDYNELLEARAGDRDYARKNWQTIGTIKELKEGYISQVVRKIADLCVQHQAFIVLEDLNTGFKRGRQKIEKSIYQKFELALAKKLNFLVDKTAQNGEIGSVTKALQLTPPVANYQDIEGKKQVGIMLYTRANYTSQTDPVTGWRKSVYLKAGAEESTYTKEGKIKNKGIKDQIIEQFKDIYFDGKDYVFEYANQITDKNTGDVICEKLWKLYSGKDGISLDRFRGKRGKEKNEWRVEKIDIVKILDGIFDEFDKGRSLLSQIVDEGIELAKVDEKHTAWESLRFAIELIQQIRNTGHTERDNDFILSPVRDENGVHFDSRIYWDKEQKGERIPLPSSGDANGAFNIARKGFLMNEHIKKYTENGKPKNDKKSGDLNLFISDEEWDFYLLDKGFWKQQLPVLVQEKNGKVKK